MRLPLIPREEKFFDLFIDDARNMLGAARLLEQFFRNYDERERLASQLRDAEHAGDQISHDIGRKLEATFVTPLRPGGHPRPDQPVGRHCRLYRGGGGHLHPVRDRPTVPDRAAAGGDHRPPVRADHRRPLQAAGFKGLEQHWIEIHRLENEGDRIVRQAMAELFKNGHDPIEIIKWKDVYDVAEQTIDACEDAANVIERIVVSMLDAVVWTLIVVLGLAIAFDYINGFHDTANAIATSVSTRALRPDHAIALSAVANFVGALIGTAVAATIGAGLIDEGTESQLVVAAALIGAIVWNLITWRAGIPSSSSHALIGGLLGASFAAAGIESWNLEGIRDKVLIPLVTSPIIGFLLGLAVMVVIFNVFKGARPRIMNDSFRRLQVLSAGYMALSHGSNDAQKTMGVMTLALLNAGVIDEFVVPIEISCWPPRPSRWGPPRGAGGSSRRWAPGSSSSTRCMASPRRRRPPPSSLAPPRWACRSAPPTSSPAPSWAPAYPTDSTPFAGAWPATSGWRGSSPCRRPGSAPRSPTGC